MTPVQTCCRPYWYKAVLDDVGFTPAEAEVQQRLRHTINPISIATLSIITVTTITVTTITIITITITNTTIPTQVSSNLLEMWSNFAKTGEHNQTPNTNYNKTQPNIKNLCLPFFTQHQMHKCKCNLIFLHGA